MSLYESDSALFTQTNPPRQHFAPANLGKCSVCKISWYNNHSLSENRDWGQHFDTVPHKHLLKKLKLFGLTGNELKWIKYFLSGRQQGVVVNGTFSKWKPVLSGIPQGSVLRPVLSVIFMNNLPVKSYCKIFADDTKFLKPYHVPVCMTNRYYK